ncbi:hypothetical protein B0H65DRAFT_436354 [Neurospora tetraspora]|uniref:Extracellular membrane protein CFEM domain-containing protein n=1 Tax=Neurospora tetraspora TaxID=94610 RepID=A0AAE0J0L9_9PEZI|nr:hypothetical protein B0H65DRAFT_436354 [Neurospora tetraspora]
MISNRVIRFALICASSSLFYTPSRASPTSSSSSPSPATFPFPSCVESCVNVSGCNTDDPRCLCQFSGKGIFLELALTCMSYYCEAELRRADDTLIDIMEAGCKSVRQPIPEEKLEMAEAWASRLVKNLPPSPTIATTTVHQPSLPTTLVTIQPPPPPVTAITTTHVSPPTAVTTTTTTKPTTSSSSTSTSSPSDATTSAPESSSSTTSATTLQPQTSSTKPANEAATSAPAPKPRPDSSPYGPFVGPIPSSAVMGVMVSLPFLHWVSTLVCSAVAGILFA